MPQPDRSTETRALVEEFLGFVVELERTAKAGLLAQARNAEASAGLQAFLIEHSGFFARAKAWADTATLSQDREEKHLAQAIRNAISALCNRV